MITKKKPLTDENPTQPSSDGPKIYLVIAEDDYLRQKKTEEIVAKLQASGSANPYALETIEAPTENSQGAITAINRCIEALRTANLFSDTKIVLLKNATFFAENITGKAQAVKDTVEKLIAICKTAWPAHQYLIISAHKVSKRTAFYKACEKLAIINECGGSDKPGSAEKEARAFAQTILRQKGVSLEPSLLDEFMARTGTSYRQIEQEAEKLALYAADKKTLTREEIAAVVSTTREAISWAYADTVFRPDLPAALITLKQLLTQNESPIGIIASLEKRIAQLQILRICLDRGFLKLLRKGEWAEITWKVDEATTDLLSQLGSDDPRTIHPYRAAQLAKSAQNIPAKTLACLQEEVLRARQNLVSTSLPDSYILTYITVLIAQALQSRYNA